MRSILIFASSALVMASYLAYEWAIVKGKARPHRTTRLIGFVLNILVFSSLYSQGDRTVVWFSGVCTVQSFIVLIMSVKSGMGGWSKTDIICLIAAILGVTLWRVTSNPALALYASVVADLAGTIPTIVKTYRLPKTEYYLSYIFDLVSLVCIILAINRGGFNEYLYPSYLLLSNGLILIFISRKLAVSKTVLNPKLI